jgi:hypothetical protein
LLTCPAAPGATPYDYLKALQKVEAQFAAAEAAGDKSRAVAAGFQLATEQSFVGDTERAIETFRSSMVRGSKSPLGAVTDAGASQFLLDHEVRDALAAILESVRDRQIVIINEAHHEPRDRAFATLVALELRKIGFSYLAVETIGPDTNTSELAARGYPLVRDGYYSREPVFGDFLRRALAVGYEPVSYEQLTSSDLDPATRLAAREEGQAQNLVDRVFARDPNARVLIHVGYGHLWKGAADADEGRATTFMAERLRVKTGIEPFCIDQTQALSSVIAVNTAILSATKSDSFVLKSRAAPNPYSETGAVDMYVYRRPARIVKGRPHWLSMRGYRKPRTIPAKLLPKTGRHLVQAFVTGESADAVPMDQVLVIAGQPVPVLMLPKGKFRFAVQE